MYTDDVINRIRDSIDIVELISGWVNLKKTGRNWQGLCPFHNEKTPSFSVNPDKQFFHCFGCGVGGDVFKFIELQKGLSFPEAVQELAVRAGIALPENRPKNENRKIEDEKKNILAALAAAAEYFRRELAGPAGSAAREYLAKRGVSDSIVLEFGLGYARPEWDGALRYLKQKGFSPQILEKAGLVIKRAEGDGYYDRFRGRIIFPIRDINGAVIAFGGRVMDDTLPKYLNSPETPLYSKSNVLFCLDVAKDAARKNDHFIIVEGYFDAIACHQYGVRNAVATLGTALTEGHLRLMRRFTKNIKLIFDPDPAGVKAALRSFDLLVGSGVNVKVVFLPGNDDPDTFLKKNGLEAFIASLRHAEPFMDFVLHQVVKNDPNASIEEKKAWESEMLRFLDRLPSGIERDHYIKKTAEALDISEVALRQDLGVHRKQHKILRDQPIAEKTGKRSPLRPKAEEILIHLMLRNTAIARKISTELKPDDFTDPLFRRAAERIFAALADGRTSDPRSFITENDNELEQLISYYTVLDSDYNDSEKTCVDCINHIRQLSSEKRMRALLAAIKAAEARDDKQELADLQKQLIELKRARVR